MKIKNIKNTTQAYADTVVSTTKINDMTNPILEPAQETKKSIKKGPVALVILDGWGIAPPTRGNAISLARTPHMDTLMSTYPTMALHASGEMVGLPPNEMGNSEVGHINMGSGKIIYQQLPLIHRSIENGTFYNNSVFIEAMSRVKKTGKKMHLMGMVSNGGIHSSEEHLYALLLLCKDAGLAQDQVIIHAFLDGRDTEPNAGLRTIAALETKMFEMKIGVIATVMGRKYAMDRDTNWDRIQSAYNAIVHGVGVHTRNSALQAIEDAYQADVFDEEMEPTVILDVTKKPKAVVEDSDSIIFFNFRADRARQLTQAFVLPEWNEFDRGVSKKDLFFVTMTEYQEGLPVHVAFMQDNVKLPVAKIIADAGMPQLHIAETEKYAHVTFFFNGGREDSFEKEERALIQSPRVQSYVEKPKMSVEKIAERIQKEVKREYFQFFVINIANADMLGHTGDIQAAIEGIEAADTAVGLIAKAILDVSGTVLITADHGNAEEMIDARTDAVIKEHSTNPVPCIIANAELAQQRDLWPPVLQGDMSRLQPVGVLSDIGPTILRLMHLPIPKEMTGRPLIR